MMPPADGMQEEQEPDLQLSQVAKMHDAVGAALRSLQQLSSQEMHHRHDRRRQTPSQAEDDAVDCNGQVGM